MVLEGFIGSMRSGKTLAMTRELYKEYINGRKVFSNYWLNFPHEELDINDLDEAIRKKDTTKYDNSVIGLDEIHVLLDSRTSGAKRNRIVSYFVTQSGKMNCRILWTSQFLRQVEVRVRINTNYLNHCKRFIVINKKKHYISQDYKTNYFMIEINYHILSEGYGKLGFRPVRKYIITQPQNYFKLYDTLQKIYYTEQVKEDGKNKRPTTKTKM